MATRSAKIDQKADLIWAIADKLTGVYKPHEYGDVILPLTVIRRFDCILSDTKDAVLQKYDEVKNLPMKDILLRKASKKDFYNTSKYTFERLMDDPDHIEENFREYLNKFSANVRDILEKFKFDGHITTMANKGILYIVLKEYTTDRGNLHPNEISNLEMGYIFEEIIRRFSESHNEDAGQHYTPREVIQLMVNILFYDDNDILSGNNVAKTIYDPACGTGGMLSVAEEYLHSLNASTGFDEPLLHTMFVDKKLSGVKAVQTLSRLNRTTRGKVDTFVLDFVNSAEDIKASFEPFYEETVLLEETDPNVVYDMKNTLDDFRVYQKSEVDKFADIFYQNENQSAGDLGKLQGQLRPAIDRYEVLEVEKQDIFKSTLASFNRVYAYITQVCRLFDKDIHRFSIYSKFLYTMLPKGHGGEKINIDDKVLLEYYKLEKDFEGPIELESTEGGYTPISGDSGHREPKKDPLTVIIDKINEKYGTHFTEIYWNGIRTFGIFCDYGLSIPEYVSLAVKLKEQKSVSRLGNRNDDAEENDKDDSDAGDIGNIRFWNLPIYHDDWRDNLTIELTQEEAFYLDKQIQKSTKGSLLEYVLKNHIDLNEYDDFASLTAELSEKVSEKLAYMMKLACDFNNLVYMARVRYNVMLSEDENTYANDEWSRLLPDIRHNATVDLDAVFGELQLINPRAKSFLSGIQTAFMASDIDMADELIRKRERSLKGAARAKLSRTKEFDHSKWVGGGMLDYRFSNARRIVNDIYAGEVNADV